MPHARGHADCPHLYPGAVVIESELTRTIRVDIEDVLARLPTSRGPNYCKPERGSATSSGRTPCSPWDRSKAGKLHLEG